MSQGLTLAHLFTYKAPNAMEIYNDLKEKTEDIFDDLTNHLEARWNLGVLNTAEKVADAISTATAAIVLGVIASFALFFLSLGLAWAIGNSLNNFALGLFIVGGLYVIAGLIVYYQLDNLIKMPVINAFIQRFYHED